MKIAKSYKMIIIIYDIDRYSFMVEKKRKEKIPFIKSLDTMTYIQYIEKKRKPRKLQ